MSNRNRNANVNPASNNGGSNTPVPANGGKKKVTLIGKMWKIRDKVMANKWGRRVVTGLKIAGVGAGCFVSYKAGVRSVKPTTVVIREGITDEEEEVLKEAEATEAEAEPASEETV